MTCYLFDGVDLSASPSGSVQVSLSLVPITEAPSGNSEPPCHVGVNVSVQGQT